MFAMKQVTAAIVGAGFAGNFHCSAFKKVSTVDVRLKTVVDTDLERALALKDRWGFEIATEDYEAVLQDPEIDLVDITTTPAVHAEFSIRALNAGKHVICEKPLTGYFGLPGDVHPIGDTVSKRVMYEALLREIDAVREAVNRSSAKFMYAENYVYAPTVVKAAELIRAKKTRVLYSVGECSVHGSTSEFSRLWKYVGGGTIMRLGAHPIAGVLYLKQVEAQARGVEICVESVSADVERVSAGLVGEERKHLRIDPVDVEDFGNLTITFSDGSKSIVYCNDSTMGGIRNKITLYGNNGVIECNMTIADNMKVYFLDQEGLEDVYFSEMLRHKTGWNNVMMAEETLRGYMAELSEFAECACENREPQAGFQLAYDTTKVIYAAYLSAEEGRRVDF